MASKIVRVELDDLNLPCRIFRDKSWKLLPEDKVEKMTKAEAVHFIRRRVFARAQHSLSGAECERCGRYLDWFTMEMNERIPKGSGGEVSMSNCEALCHDCHQGRPDSSHGNRRWQTSKIKSDEGPDGN